MSTVSRKTDAEVVSELRADTPLNRARRVFSSWSAKIEKTGGPSGPLGPVEWRRMEFEAVREIGAALGVPL